MRALPLLLIAPMLLVPAAAQSIGPDLVLIQWHPYPDGADPLGFEFPVGSGSGYYLQAHQRFDTDDDGFDFPHVVFDAVLPLEGLPDGPPFQATLDAYQTAYQDRAAGDRTAPRIAITTTIDDRIVGAIDVDATAVGEPLRLWVAVVEDHVHFDAGRLGNGITDHRYVARTLTDFGKISGNERIGLSSPIDPAWDLDRTYLAAWLTADAGRFEQHEVLQATIHPVSSDQVTVRDERAVLMEMWSATWCDPCLFGDLAADELVDAHGPPDVGAAPRPGLWRGVDAWALAGAVVVAALFVWRRP